MAAVLHVLTAVVTAPVVRVRDYGRVSTTGRPERRMIKFARSICDWRPVVRIREPVHDGHHPTLDGRDIGRSVYSFPPKPAR